MKKYFFIFLFFFNACSNSYNISDEEQKNIEQTPTVDYIEKLDIYTSNHNDLFLKKLAMNYRSYSIYNARTSGFADIGEVFAQKVITAYSGEVPLPESIKDWQIDDESKAFEFYENYKKLINLLKRDVSVDCPELAAEAQAKFDCWLSSFASGQIPTANKCEKRFYKAIRALEAGGEISIQEVKKDNIIDVKKDVSEKNDLNTVYYPETKTFMENSLPRSREGIIIVNNVNIPPSMVLNQNIYNKNKKDCSGNDCKDNDTKDDFSNIISEIRREIDLVNERLDNLQNVVYEKATLKIERSPIVLESNQKIIEELLEIRFDFDKSEIKDEYKGTIIKLAKSMKDNKNIKVSIIGHTDRAGSNDYNYALGGRRAKAVREKLIELGIPAQQIISVSAGEENNKIKTFDGEAKSENRRVSIAKETVY